MGRCCQHVAGPTADVNGPILSRWALSGSVVAAEVVPPCCEHRLRCLLLLRRLLTRGALALSASANNLSARGALPGGRLVTGLRHRLRLRLLPSPGRHPGHGNESLSSGSSWRSRSASWS